MVLPFVPVMPTTVNDREGSPKRRKPLEPRPPAPEEPQPGLLQSLCRLLNQKRAGASG